MSAASLKIRALCDLAATLISMVMQLHADNGASVFARKKGENYCRLAHAVLQIGTFFLHRFQRSFKKKLVNI